MQLQCLPLLWAKKKDGSQYLTQKTGFNTLFTRVVLVKLGGKFHEKPSKGEEGLWRVAEMATKNAMFIGQPHTQRHLWRKRNGQKLDRKVKSVNLKYIKVGQLDDDMIVPPSDGPMFILINWE